jgi:hypothetical protein
MRGKSYRVPIYPLRPGDYTAPDAWFKVFVQQPVRALIVSPSRCAPPVEHPATVTLVGKAWSGAGDVTKVEVSYDNGVSWLLAVLSPPANMFARCSAFLLLLFYLFPFFFCRTHACTLYLARTRPSLPIPCFVLSNPFSFLLGCPLILVYPIRLDKPPVRFDVTALVSFYGGLQFIQRGGDRVHGQ